MEAGGYYAGHTAKGWGPGVLPPQSGRTRNPAGNAYNSIKRQAHTAGINDIDYPSNFAKFLDERIRRKQVRDAPWVYLPEERETYFMRSA